MAVKKQKSEGLGVADLAKAMGIKEATARVKLRDAKVKKTGGVYSWSNQAALKKVIQQLEA